MIKKPRKYTPQYPVQYYAESMALEIGDSLSKFMEVVDREFNEIKTKGVQFSHIEITFICKNMSLTSSTVQVKIFSDLTGKLHTNYGPEDTTSRMFHVRGRDGIENTFWLIYFWKEELVKNHQKHLKQEELKQSQLFK